MKEFELFVNGLLRSVSATKFSLVDDMVYFYVKLGAEPLECVGIVRLASSDYVIERACVCTA